MWLGIDTSGTVSVAVADDPAGSATTTVRAVLGDDRARHHDEVLLGLIDQALRDAGITRGDLTGIVAGRGPGPFTGLRVGLVVARTLAFVLDVPLRGCCSLDALAHQAAARVISGQEQGPLEVAVALDARRREVYHARYTADRGSLVRTEGPAVAAPAQIAPQLRQARVLVGSGTELYPELLPATAPLHHVDAGHLLQVAALEIAAGEDLTSTAPLYLRAPDAARPTARKSALGR
ncbi:tRNA (adenosine(37)-N6)-threonylcarbamoyltransferase complex dimerization subunit type 1 TsaB [Brachybacterium sp. AOP25-B2-12]|uniref:tRNA (adenosine(37)-N6)-threonylcarbamoyltransferase complex dimerization subunit type 1 TsaB n=1 Tax=Brachybacterium sp. AOP25-B2-12 TaxID=3457710 RepID=UPI00403342D7